jgi:hypothetical protein
MAPDPWIMDVTLMPGEVRSYMSEHTLAGECISIGMAYRGWETLGAFLFFLFCQSQYPDGQNYP